ncbi:protein SSUH2 homolog isoform X2 [Podarcis raffonei]|uniref:protein SSUH2 homolog isoform X2 n=1 Tax=Podarcis raffonei TaxID=65483 RepID=UPI00232951FE|nr:protein SSUH2 homolog isoform X2 [Podarcis raffonei]
MKQKVAQGWPKRDPERESKERGCKGCLLACSRWFARSDGGRPSGNPVPPFQETWLRCQDLMLLRITQATYLAMKAQPLQEENIACLHLTCFLDMEVGNSRPRERGTFLPFQKMKPKKLLSSTLPASAATAQTQPKRWCLMTYSYSIPTDINWRPSLNQGPLNGRRNLMGACPTCGSTGRRHCNKCNGNSKQQCGRCHGRGVRFVDDTCDLCLGSGLENCQECSGMGKTVCNDCEGKGQLLSFIELQVEWQNNVYEYVADERSGFPIELFKTVTGETLFVDDSPMVYPVISFPDFGVSQASSYAVEQHQAQFASTRRILRQRQTIELILLTRVQYLWHGKPYSFYVYGKERKVHAEDYPQKCCCTIL